jgi:hypothetical protein
MVSMRISFILDIYLILLTSIGCAKTCVERKGSLRSLNHCDLNEDCDGGVRGKDKTVSEICHF